MKKIFLASLLAIFALGFTACDSDRDDNPTLSEQAPASFKLNTPAYATGTYDLEHSQSIELTCSQPAYGFTAATKYSVEVSLDEAFTSFETLPSTYNTAKMNVDASELAVATTTLKVAAGAVEEEFPLTFGIYLRLKASLGKDQWGNNLGETTSNVINLPSVKTAFALPPVLTPEQMWLIGNFNGWDWASAPEMVKVANDSETAFWSVVWLDGGFKFNSATAWDGGERGFEGTTVTDNAGAGVADDGGNIGIANAGWYIVVIRPTVEGRNVNYSVEINKPEVWLIGGCVEGKWDELMEGWTFTVPTTKEGEFVSPEFITDAPEGPRAYVKIEPFEWWRSEFMVFDGKLKYRGTGGDMDRVTSKAGQKLYINFGTGEGRIE